MRRVGVIALLFVFFIDCQGQAQPGKQDMEILAKYVTDRQFTGDSTINGAIWTYAFPADHDSVYEVIPYYAHYAALGLLRYGSPAGKAAVKKWMNWYLSHQDEEGRMVNHFYYLAKDTILGADDNDMQDAEPAMFWVLAAEYYTLTKDKTYFTPAVKKKLETSARFITENLMDADYLTFANVNFAMKYTIGNSEVYEGFMALSTMEKEIYKDENKSAAYKEIALKTQSAILLRLLDPVSGMYKISSNTKANMANWYDGAAATIWPQFCGVEDYSADHSRRQREALSAAFSDQNGKDWTVPDFIKMNPFPIAAVGYVYTMAADTAGLRQLTYVIQLFKDPDQSDRCNIEEAGWAMMHLAAILKKQ